MIPDFYEPKLEAAKAIRAVAFAVLMALLLALGLLAVGCSATVAPARIEAAAASFDGGLQNSGFIGWSEEGFGVITDHAHDRYNALIDTYGRDFTPSLKKDAGTWQRPDGSWLIDKEHLSKFLEMAAWQRARLQPVRP